MMAIWESLRRRIDGEVALPGLPGIAPAVQRPVP
jgi:hypothetical protein